MSVRFVRGLRGASGIKRGFALRLISYWGLLVEFASGGENKIDSSNLWDNVPMPNNNYVSWDKTLVIVERDNFQNL